MKYPLIFLFLLACSYLHTQTWQWAKIETAMDGDFLGICNDPDGNIIIACGFNGSFTVGTSTVTTPGLKQGLIKYDIAGNFLWMQHYPYTPGNNLFISDIKSDADGNILVGGNFEGTRVVGATTLTSFPNAVNVFLIKYDSQGNVLWAKQGGGPYIDMINSICTDAQGNCFVTGYSQSYLFTFGSTTFTHNPGVPTEQFFALKYDPNGNLLWAITNPDGAIIPQSICTNPAGDIFITGSIASFTAAIGNYTFTTAAGDYIVAKFDTNGNLLWAVDDGANCYGTTISTDPAGDVYVSGTFAYDIPIGGITYTNTYQTAGDIFLVKYSGLGVLQWVRTAGGIDWDYAHSHVSYAGGVFLAGSLGSNALFVSTTTVTIPIFDPANPTPIDNMFLLQYNSQGTLLNASGFNGFGNDKMELSLHNGCNLYLGSDLMTPTISVGPDTLTMDTPGSGREQLIFAKYISGINSPTLSVTDASVCAGSAVTLSVSGAQYYVWSQGSGGNQIVVSPTITTIYTITASDPNFACVATETVSVTAIALPTLSTNSTGTLICQGENASFAVTGADTYTWNTGAQTSVLSMIPGIAGSYTVTGTDNQTGCENSATFNLNVGACTGIAAQRFENNISIYPNPAQHQLTLSAAEALGKIEIYNSLGQKILETKSLQTIGHVDVKNLPQGVYVLIIHQQSFKFIKE